jgi:hypothetical protein
MAKKIEPRYQSKVPIRYMTKDLGYIVEAMNEIDIISEELQREFVVERIVNWMPNFIADILCGEDLGTIVISLQEEAYTVEWRGEEKQVKYKLLDAQQRLTMIWLFMHDKVKVQEETMLWDKNGRPINIGGMVWSDIKRKYPDFAEEFLSRPVFIKKYGAEDNYLNTKEESKRFKLIQAGLSLKAQEVRQCTKAMIAKETRDDVRLRPIPLYKLMGAVDNIRMKVEEGRAIHIHYLWHKFKVIGPKALDEMYDDPALEDPEDECTVYSALYGKDIRLFKVLKPIEDLMAKILEDKQFYSVINTQYYHSLFFFCSLLIQYGYVIDDTDELKWLFFQKHVQLVKPIKDDNGEERDSYFGHALSLIGTKKHLEHVVDTWTKELGLEENE